MLDGARARAAELGLSNVEFQVLGAEWIDLPLASVDAVVCRWGYMLMADPAAALSETRRVLRPGGRLALAVWDAIEHNPWAGLPAAELRQRGLVPAPQQGQSPPGPFALGNGALVAALLEDAGFTQIDVQGMEVMRRHESFDELWEVTLDLSRSFHDTVMARPKGDVEEIRAGLAKRLEPFTRPDGTLEVPGRTLVAAASA
jgi:SAM-dependent methyltransferase